MLNFQPLIDRFVDDVINAIRRAAIEDLRGLALADAATGNARAATADGVLDEKRREAPRARATLREPSITRGGGRRVSRARTERSTRTQPSPSAVPASPAPVAEITDPESLLAAITFEPAPVVVTQPAPAPPERSPDGEGDGPPSSVRSLHEISPVRLMGNETLARVSSAGVVIRRGRRA
jgi:hypothetical protein